jgi:pimeloyl-ACP methyl ester carboxylesterase
LLAACAAYSSHAVGRLERRHRPAGRRVPVTGGFLHLVDKGPRRGRHTVVLLHGASGNLADMTLSLAPALASRYRVIAVDRPGHGWSDRPGGTEDASPARQAALIKQALRHVGVERAIIVGHSWSGALACRFALGHRELTAGVVLVAAATHPWPGGVAWYYSSATHPLTSPLFLRTLVAPVGLAAIDQGIRAIFAPQEPVPGYAEAIGAGLLMRPSQFRANAEDMTGLHAFVTEQSPHYDAIDVPVGIVTGTADAVVPDLHSRTIHRQIRGSRLTLLPGIGHMPHHVATDHVVDEVDWVASVIEARARRAAVA